MDRWNSPDRAHPRQQQRRGPSQRSQLDAPKQLGLQFVDDTWERLLNALERLEQVTEGFRHISAARLDRHRDRERVEEDEVGVRSEVHLQIKALQRVVRPVLDEVTWMVPDFLRWLGGREDRDLAPVDEYGIPVLQCIRGEAYRLPDLAEVGPVGQADLMDAVEQLGAGLHAADRMEDEFRSDPDREATKHEHGRGGIEQGVRRLHCIDGTWAAEFVRTNSAALAEWAGASPAAAEPAAPAEPAEEQETEPSADPEAERPADPEAEPPADHEEVGPPDTDQHAREVTT